MAGVSAGEECTRVDRCLGLGCWSLRFLMRGSSDKVPGCEGIGRE